jgi:hypothetical protein
MIECKGEIKMSPKQKHWFLIGGAIVIGVCVLSFLGFVLLRPSATRLETSSNIDMAYQRALEEKSGFGAGEGFVEYDDMEAARGEMPPGAPMEAPAMEPVPDIAVAGDTGAPQQPIDHLIIRNGNITVAVDDTVAARKNIEDMVAGMIGDGAFVVSVNERGSGSASDPYIDMSIRVPAARFDDVMSQIAGMAVEGTIPTQSQSAADVTNQYVDLDARLETLEAARRRLLEIISEAQDAEDLLYAEQQLTQREAEIASIKGQMQYLSQSAELSSISISLQPYILSQPVDNHWRPAETVRRAWEDLLESLRDFGDFAITFGIVILPWLVAAGLVIYGIARFVVLRVRKGREIQKSSTEQ